MKTKFTTREMTLDLLFFSIAAVIYSISVNCFTAPNDIAPGGVNGLATAINYLTDWPIGLVSLAINMPLLIMATILIGGKLTVKTILTSVLSSVAIDALAFVLPTYTEDKLLACLFGGLLTGISTGIYFLRGGTGGGTDIVARLMRLKWKNISAGKCILIADVIVILFAWLVYGNMENVMYAAVVITVSTFVVDKIIYGGDRGKCYIIVSEQSEEIAAEVSHRLRRGITFIDGKGYFSEKPTEVILCSIRDSEAYAMRNIVREKDPYAFAIALEATQILGHGFRPWEKPED